MSEVTTKSRPWLWWIAVPVFVFVVYPLSTIPFAIISDRMVGSGIISRAAVERVIDGLYAPVIQIPPLRDGLSSVIKRLTPRRRP